MTSSTLFACAKMLGKIKVWLRLRRATLCVVVLHFACSSHTLFFYNFPAVWLIGVRWWWWWWAVEEAFQVSQCVEHSPIDGEIYYFFCVLFLEFLLSTLVSRQFFLVVAFFSPPLILLSTSFYALYPRAHQLSRRVVVVVVFLWRSNKKL